jgi:hypothetical protein
MILGWLGWEEISTRRVVGRKTQGKPPMNIIISVGAKLFLKKIATKVA